MKKLSIILLAAALAGISAVNAQAPRIRTSAPVEKTAQKGAPKKAKGAKPAAANGAAAAAAPGAKKGGKKGAGKAASVAAETHTSSSDLYMALKTNLAYDAFGVLNLAYECQFADHWTAELPVMWSLWDWKESRGLRTVALQPGVKYWFSKPGSGHAVGADFDLAWYNARWDDDRYQVEGRPAMGASILYAYSLNMGRGWKAEFSLGVGYVNTRYNTYYNITDGALIDTRTKNYFGPTRLGITLAYSF
ncbi:MAG: DUF3575 domain-containing protein [Muribaculaceae bacterium]|nr:DUF3575 domain-containing protein [Muribaculaceae bacterium]